MDNRRAVVGLFAVVLVGVVAVVVYLASPRKKPAAVETPVAAQDPPAQQDDPYKPNQNYVIAPANEPVWPAVADHDAIKRAGHASFQGGYQYDIRKPDGTRRCGVVVGGTILMDRGLIELFACAEGGKEYESSLRFECDVQALDQAMLLCGLKRGDLPGRPGPAERKQGSRVVVLVQWQADGKALTYHAEDLILHSKRDRTMPRVGWTYVGHWAQVPDPTAAGKKTYNVLAATGTRSIMTTYHDQGTVLDNPLEEAEQGEGPETLFAANYMLLPDPGTKVLIILRAPSADEAKEIAAVEKELSK